MSSSYLKPPLELNAFTMQPLTEPADAEGDEEDAGDGESKHHPIVITTVMLIHLEQISHSPSRTGLPIVTLHLPLLTT